MQNVGYFVPADAPASSNTLDRRDAATPRRKTGRRDDPQWKAIKERAQANGPIVSNVVSVFLEPTDFSPMK